MSADGSSDNSLVNTVLKDSRDGTSFPHPMDPTIPVAVLGDCEVRAHVGTGTHRRKITMLRSSTFCA